MIQLKLRTRLTIWAGCVMAVFITAVFFWMHLGLMSILESKNRHFLMVEGQEFQAAVQDRLTGGADTLEAQIRREVGAFASEGLVVVQCKSDKTEVFPTNANNIRIASEFHNQFNPQMTEPTEMKINGNSFLVHRIWVRESENQKYPIYLVLSLDETRMILSQFDQSAITGGVLFLSLALGGGYFFATRALKPVARSVQAAQMLNPEFLSERLPITGTGDELDELAITINGLLDRVSMIHNQIVRFTADASHELRSPLGAMRAMVEVALQKPRSIIDYQSVLESLGEQCDGLSHMVDSMLMLARADTGEIQLKCYIVNIRNIAEEIIELFQPLAEEKEIYLELKEQTGDFNSWSDGQRLRQLFINLVDNAIKFSRAGGRIQVSLIRNSQTIEICVEDQGFGVPEAQIHRIFERFYQVDSARATGGSGLGLSICKWICEAHGGKIQAKNRESGGLRIEIQMPLRLPLK